MSPKVIIISLVGIVVLTLGMIWLVTRNQVATITPDTSIVSKVEVSETIGDLGEMKVKDEGTKDFVIKNVGTNPLQITSVSSSCNCTFGQIIYKGQTSKEYGLHAPGGFVNEIAVGDTAIVRVTYRPYIMPVYGPIQRDVYIGTNDPQNPKLTFSVKAVVK